MLIDPISNNPLVKLKQDQNLDDKNEINIIAQIKIKHKIKDRKEDHRWKHQEKAIFSNQIIEQEIRNSGKKPIKIQDTGEKR